MMVKISPFLCRIANLPLICLIHFVHFVDWLPATRDTPTEFKLFGYLKVKRKFLSLKSNLWLNVLMYLFSILQVFSTSTLHDVFICVLKLIFTDLGAVIFDNMLIY